jgi:hypothetical protein
MKYLKFFSLKPDQSTGWLIVMYFFTVLFWCLLIAIAINGRLNNNLVFLWFLFAGLMIGGKGALFSQSIVRGMAVLRQLRAPQSLGRAYLSAVVSHASLIWVFLSAGGAVLLVISGFAWVSISAVTFFSTLLSISTLTSLPSNHIWVRFCRGFLISLATVVTLLILWKGYNNPIEYLHQVPVWLLAGLTLSWPLTMHLVARKLNTAMSFSADSFPSYKKNYIKSLTAYLERFSPLVFNSLPAFPVQPTLFDKLYSLVVMSCLSLVLLSLFSDGRWNRGIGPIHFFGMLLVASVSCNLLLFKDMHWRILLSPGRLKRNSFGWHIFSVSIVVQFFVYVAFACIGMLGAFIALDISPNQALENAWSYRAVPFQLLAANSLALLLSAVVNSRWTGLVIVAIAFLLAGITFALYGFSLQTPIWLYVDFSYLLSLCAVTIICVLLSNRLWTRQRILRHMQVYQEGRSI